MRVISNDKNENVKITEGTDNYISNVMLIVEFFINCGFLPTLLMQQEENKKSHGFINTLTLQNNETIVESEEFKEAYQSLGQIDFFWQYLVRYQSRLSTVQYVQFGTEQNFHDKTKGLIWLIVSLNNQETNNDLQEAFKCMFEDEKYMKLYEEVRIAC